MNEGTYGKYIIQELKSPEMAPEFKKMYEKFAERILWLDSNVVEGAIQMNTAWYFGIPEKDPVFEEHAHDNNEIIGFFGSNPDDKYNLNGEIEITINGEVHTLTKSSLIWIPSGLPHMRISVKKVDLPIFHFSILLAPEYVGGAYK